MSGAVGSSHAPDRIAKLESQGWHPEGGLR